SQGRRRAPRAPQRARALGARAGVRPLRRRSLRGRARRLPHGRPPPRRGALAREQRAPPERAPRPPASRRDREAGGAPMKNRDPRELAADPLEQADETRRLIARSPAEGGTSTDGGEAWRGKALLACLKNDNVLLEALAALLARKPESAPAPLA